MADGQDLLKVVGDAVDGLNDPWWLLARSDAALPRWTASLLLTQLRALPKVKTLVEIKHLASRRRKSKAIPGNSGNTGYTGCMAKVMVSLPDELLRAIDVEATRRGTSRSGLLRALAEETLRRRSTRRAQRMV